MWQTKSYNVYQEKNENNCNNEDGQGYSIDQGWARFFCKGLENHYLGSEGHSFYVVTAQLCPWGMKAAVNNM